MSLAVSKSSDLQKVKPEIPVPSKANPPTPALPAKSPLEEMCDLYHTVLDSPQQLGEFWERYHPIRVGVVNAMERLRDMTGTLEADFQTSNSGSYYVVEIPSDSQSQFTVVPQFDLTLQVSNVGPGAMGEVFDCPGFDPKLRYRRVRVVKPAFFEPDSARQRWKLIERGQLNIGQGE